MSKEEQMKAKYCPYCGKRLEKYTSDNYYCPYCKVVIRIVVEATSIGKPVPKLEED